VTSGDGDVSRETSPSESTGHAALLAAAGWAGIDLSEPQLRTLNRFRRWLGDEAIAMGGLGPGEHVRVVDRHLADSLVFAEAWRGWTPETLIDVGSGVGLPGIPLAVAMPEAAIVLLDRSERRCRLARRAVRMLELENVEVLNADVGEVVTRSDVATFRAALPPAEAFRVGSRLVSPGGMVVVAASRTRAPSRPFPDGADLIEVPDGVLDSPSWLLRMRVTQPKD
jgi:16S rRNA (guanine527-N7)-methyltransferase